MILYSKDSQTSRSFLFRSAGFKGVILSDRHRPSSRLKTNLGTHSALYFRGGGEVMDYDKFDLEHYQKLQGEVQQLRAELALALDALEKIDKRIRFDHRKNLTRFSLWLEHTKQDAREALSQIKRKPLAVVEVVCTKSKYGWIGYKKLNETDLPENLPGTLFVWPNEEGE